MGAWGVNSDENDSASDAIDGIKNVCGLYADADEMSPLEGQALADAQDAALLTRDVPWKAEGLVGSVMALAAATSAAAILQWGWTVPAAAALALATGLVCGTITGMISVAWRLPSFIVSLGMLEAVRGSAYVVTDSRTQYVGDAISWLSAPFFGGISFAFLLLATRTLQLRRLR